MNERESDSLTCQSTQSGNRGATERAAITEPTIRLPFHTRLHSTPPLRFPPSPPYRATLFPPHSIFPLAPLSAADPIRFPTFLPSPTFSRPPRFRFSLAPSRASFLGPLAESQLRGSPGLTCISVASLCGNACGLAGSTV